MKHQTGMIITINKTKELTRKEYVDFLHKTKGETISEARISQLVSAGRLKVRDYPELNNLQLIVLDDDEQALAQSRFTTTQAIHTYSYKELGLMVGKLIHDLTNENGNAKTLLTEKEEQFDQLLLRLQQTEQERDQARQLIEELRQSLQQGQQENQLVQAESNQRQATVDSLLTEAVQQQNVIADLRQKLEQETGFRKEFDEFKQLIMGVLQAGKIREQKKPAKRKSSKQE